MVLEPVQIKVLAVVVTFASEPTFTTTVCDPEHPFNEPVTVYVVVVDGVAVTLAPTVVFKPVDGVHVKFCAPLATSEALEPLQMEVVPLTVMFAWELTATAMDFEAVQPFEPVPVTVYVVETEGVAITELPLLTFNVAAGVHAYEFAPETLNDAEVPGQTDVFEDAFSVGGADNVTGTVLVEVQPFSVAVTV